MVHDVILLLFLLDAAFLDQAAGHLLFASPLLVMLVLSLLLADKRPDNMLVLFESEPSLNYGAIILRQGGWNLTEGLADA